MKYIKFFVPKTITTPITVSGVDQNYRINEDWAVWSGEGVAFPEIEITSFMCVTQPLIYHDLSQEEETFYKS
jgi:hypothetical protein